MTSNLFIFFQKTDLATVVVLIGVVVIILVAVIVSSISDNQDEKEKDDWLKKNSEKLKAINNFELNGFITTSKSSSKMQKMSRK